MSAYVVDTDTIDYLVAAAGRYGSTFYCPRAIPEVYTLKAFTPDDAAELAQLEQIYGGNTYQIAGISYPDVVGGILLAQNVLSVNYRYRLDDEIPRYRYQSHPYSEIDAVLVLKSIACLRYQSCESADYDKSFAAYILDTLQHDAIAHLPGYDEAPWGWTRPRPQAVA